MSPGGNGTSTISATDVGGFTGTVTLAATGLPTGVSANFAPGSAAGTQVLTFTASTSAPTSPSAVAVTITGTSGSLSATTTLDLTITPEPGIAPGSGGTTSLTITPGTTTGIQLASMPDGGQIQKVYDDSAPSPTVTTCQLINGTAGATCSASSPPPGWKTTLDTMDGVGHAIESELVSDPSGPTFTATSYDGLGRKYQVSNPTRCSPPTTNCGTETTWGDTTYTYDALGRTTLVTEADNSVITTTYDQTLYNVTDTCTIVTDEAGNSRESCADALGRITFVLEGQGGGETQYFYDASNNLRSVLQGSGSTGRSTLRQL